MKYENTMDLFVYNNNTLIFSQGTMKSKNLLLTVRTHPLQLSTLIRGQILWGTWKHLYGYDMALQWVEANEDIGLVCWSLAISRVWYFRGVGPTTKAAGVCLNSTSFVSVWGLELKHGSFTAGISWTDSLITLQHY